MKLNDKKLREELHSAVLKEKRYVEVDETKKRSITTAECYDDYRNLVHCAEIGQKPVTREEMNLIAGGQNNQKNNKESKRRPQFNKGIALSAGNRNSKSSNDPFLAVLYSKEQNTN